MEIEESQSVHHSFNIFIVCEYSLRVLFEYRILNEISRNVAGYLHVPGTLLKDIGFSFIPEFSNPVFARLRYV